MQKQKGFLMSPEEQNIAIARICGFKEIYVRQTEPYFDGEGWTSNEYLGGVLNEFETSIPDYIHDLNAMHEAEKSLSGDQLVQYVKWLNRDHPQACLDALNKNDPDDIYDEAFLLIHSSPEAKAMAFLKSCRLWEASS